MPFSIHYDSGLMYYLSLYSASGSTYPHLNWVPTAQSPGPFNLPFLSFQAVIKNSGYSASGNEGQNYTYYQCNWTTNFVFRGLDGVQYPLGQLGASWSNTADEPGDTPDPYCPYTPPAGGTFHGILVAPGTQNPNQVYGQPSMTLTDASGTAYSFAAMPIGSLSSYASFSSAELLLPQTITDRNGNQITLAILGNNEMEYVDTLGRPVVSWTSSQTETNISVSGFGNVSIAPSADQIALTFPGTMTDTAHTNLACIKNPSQPYATKVPQTSVISLPNNKSYTLTYDPSFGQINQIVYPEGGSVTYTWGTNSDSSSGNGSYTFVNPVENVVTIESCSYEFDTPAITERVVNDGKQNVLQQQFSYTTAWNPAPLEAWIKTTTVITKDLISGKNSVTTYTYGPITADIYNSSSWLSASVPVERNIVYKDCGTNPVEGNDCSGAVLEVVNKTWGDVRHVIGEQTILSNGQGSAKQYCYDTNEQLTDVYEYSFQQEGSKPPDPTCYTSAFSVLGSGEQGDPGLSTSAIGPLMRHTVTALHNFVGATPPTHIVNEPDSITVSDSSGNQAKQTSYIYTNTTTSSTGATKTGIASPPGLRGNAMSVTQWQSNGTSPATNYAYYETGQVASMTDSKNNTTGYVYTDSPSGGNSWGNSNAYLTMVTDPLGHTRKFSYNYPSGKVVSSTDNNNKTTGYQYNTQAPQCSTTDQLDRVTEIDYPDQGVTAYCYNDSFPTSIATNQKLIGSVWKASVSTMDGLGHVTEIQLPGPAYTLTSYDGMGRFYQVGNPTRCNPPGTSCGESTWGVTTYGYDALGRKTSQTDSDGSSTESWNYNGNIVSFTDEDANVWQRTSDGLGRLKQVVEPKGAATYYTYNALDNLTCAAQDGGTGATFTTCASAPASWRSRSFAYDTLSRLITATNPETGTVCYGIWSNGACAGGYDGNGNLVAKTDARGVVTSYGYDALNRLLGKTYTNAPAATLSSCYQYDTASNGTGRLGSEWTQSGTCPSAPTTFTSLRAIGGYDSMGRVASERQCVAGYCTSAAIPASPSANCTSLSSAVGLQYCYDLSGDLFAYSNGVTTQAAGSYPQHAILFSQTSDGAGRLSTISSSWSDSTHPPTLFSSPTYAPTNALSNWLLGSSLWTSRQYDNRLRVCNQQSAPQQGTAPQCP